MGVVNSVFVTTGLGWLSSSDTMWVSEVLGCSVSVMGKQMLVTCKHMWVCTLKTHIDGYG